MKSNNRNFQQCFFTRQISEVRRNPSKKREQTIYFYLKYPPKVGHKKPTEDSQNSNEDNNSSILNIEEESKKN